MKKTIGIMLISIFIFSTAWADQPDREKPSGNPLHHIIASLDDIADIMLRQNEILENLNITSSTESKTEKANVRMVIRDRFLAAADNVPANLIFLDIYLGKDLVKTIKHSVLGFDRLTKEPKIYTFEDSFMLTYKYINGTYEHSVFFCYDKEPPFAGRRFY
jgi:hypothetical protein